MNNTRKNGFNDAAHGKPFSPPLNTIDYGQYAEGWDNCIMDDYRFDEEEGYIKEGLRYE